MLSRRLSTRFTRSVTSRTRPSSLCFASIASTASTLAASPLVFSATTPTFGWLNRRSSSASSSSRHARSTHAPEPAFASSSGVCGSAPSGARTVRVAVCAASSSSKRDVLALGAERLELHRLHGPTLAASDDRVEAALHGAVEVLLAPEPRRPGSTRPRACLARPRRPSRTRRRGRGGSCACRPDA